MSDPKINNFSFSDSKTVDLSPKHTPQAYEEITPCKDSKKVMKCEEKTIQKIQQIQNQQSDDNQIPEQQKDESEIALKAAKSQPKKKRIIQRISFAPMQEEDEIQNNNNNSLINFSGGSFGEKTMSIFPKEQQEQEDGNTEYTVNLFTRKNQNSDKLSINYKRSIRFNPFKKVKKSIDVSDEDEDSNTQSNEEKQCFFSGQQYSTIKTFGYVENSNYSQSIKQMNTIPTKKLELGSFNSFAMGTDNNMYNLLNKDLLFKKEGSSLLAVSKNIILEKLKLDDESGRHMLISANQESGEQGNTVNIVKKKVSCNCKKSKCLKLYCDCFAAGGKCGPECQCDGCNNNEEHEEELEKAIQETKLRNPQAFQSKIIQSAIKNTDESSEAEPVVKQEHIKGCNCKKSGCQKKYCECYNSGVKCTSACKCEECKNGIPHIHQDDENNSMLLKQQNSGRKPFLNQFASNNIQQQQNILQKPKLNHQINHHNHHNHMHMFQQQQLNNGPHPHSHVQFPHHHRHHLGPHMPHHPHHPHHHPHMLFFAHQQNNNNKMNINNNNQKLFKTQSQQQNRINQFQQFQQQQQEKENGIETNMKIEEEQNNQQQQNIIKRNNSNNVQQQQNMVAIH